MHALKPLIKLMTSVLYSRSVGFFYAESIMREYYNGRKQNFTIINATGSVAERRVICYLVLH